MKPNPSIFREYDIRGIVETDLTSEVAYHLGRAIAAQLREQNKQTVTVGRDCRPSGQWLGDALISGLLASGINTLDVGVVTTPLQYYSIRHFHAEGGVQITGSHNPPEYNGFKISLGDETIYGSQIQALGERMHSERYVNGEGAIRHVDALRPYTSEMLENVRLGKRKLKVVVDAGNGTAGPIAPEIYRALGCDVVELFCTMDASFPNHHPDPTVEENLRDLQRAVKQHQADLGIAFDGDADRLGVIDDRGHILWGDQLLILFARAVLRDVPKATIIGEVKCSKTLFDDISAHGGRPIMWKAGHSLIKAKMKETHAQLAGEMSGHIFFKHRYYGFDDGIYAGARLLEILSQQEKPLSALLADIPKTYATPEIRVDCDESQKFALVSKAQEHFRKTHDVVTVDGVRILFNDGWGLIRASNTQPILVLRFEATSQARLREIQQYVESELSALRKT